MIERVRVNKALWIGLSLLALLVSLVGVLKPEIYTPVVADHILPGVFTQDLLVILASAVTIILAVVARRESYRIHMVVLGIIGFFIYAYGIYAIEQIYNLWYPAYLALFGGSVFIFVFTFSSMTGRAAPVVELPAVTAYVSVAFAVLIAVMFNFIWFSQLIPQLQAEARREWLYSIYVIDLAFIMPGFIILSVMVLRKKLTGFVGLPALFVVGVGILSPLALAELVKPVRYGQEFIASEFWLYAVLSLAFLAFTAIYLATLRLRSGDSAP
jgi:hypothetical protein